MSSRFLAPLTPEQARRYACTSGVAALVLAAAAVLGAFAHWVLAVVFGAPALLCLLEARSLEGWRGGYLARVAQERRAKAGEPR